MITGNLDYAKRFKKKKQKSIMLNKRLRFVKGKQKEFLEEVIKNHFGTQAALGRFLENPKNTVK